MKQAFSGLKIWLFLLLLCGLIVFLSFAVLDVKVARLVATIAPHLNGLESGFGSALLLTVEASVAMALVFVRITRGRLPRLGETMALACLTSICTYAINTSVLKILFGVPNPASLFDGVHHALNWFHGTPESSFPSGHMMLAGAFSGVFMRLYPRSIPVLSVLLLISAVLLVLGDWHFVSDVISGAFAGVSVGLLAGELWLKHSAQRQNGGVPN